ncbi:MAG: hypothetical protein R2831_03350 [Chitinophagaceae bacterium]
MKKLLSTLFFSILVLFASAQQSYLYFEGIPSIPCRLEVNNQPVENMSNHYVIVPILAQGEQVVDIIFGAEMYPKQTFVIDAYEGASYGFKLAKTNEDKFYLVDLINQGKIIETNTPINFSLTTEQNIIHYFDSTALPEEVQNVIKESSKKQKESKKKVEPEKVVVNTVEEVKEPTKPLCNTSVGDEEVMSLMNLMRNKKDDIARMQVLKRKNFTACLSANQLKTILSVFNQDVDKAEAYLHFESKFLSSDQFDSIKNSIAESAWKTLKK